LTAGFVRHDSTEENLRQLRAYVEQHGRPVSLYTDKASLFQIAPRAIHRRDAPPQQLTQIGRTLKELNIEWIAAHSPQAKGRIERAFQTAQDRLVKGLLPGMNLDSVLSIRESRTVSTWDALAKPSAGPGALRSHTRREWRAVCHPAPSDTGQIGAGESSRPTAFSRCASAMERQLRPSSQSTAVASHARFFTARWSTFIATVRGARNSTPSLAPRAPPSRL
jgi:hypothetical protein